MGSRPRHSPMLSAGDTLSFLSPHLLHRIPMTMHALPANPDQDRGHPTIINNQSQPPAVRYTSVLNKGPGGCSVPGGDGQVTPEAPAGSRNSFCSYHLGFSLVGPSGPLPRETTPTPNWPVWNEVMPTRPGDNSHSPWPTQPHQLP